MGTNRVFGRRSSEDDRLLPPSRLTDSQIGYAILALIAGLLAFILPLPLMVLLVGLCVMGVVFYLEPALALLLTLTVAPLKTLIETETQFPLPLDVGQLALGVFLAMWAVRFVVVRPRTFNVSTLLVGAILLFLCGSAISFWAAYSPATAFREWFKWVQVLLLVVVIGQMGRWQWVVAGLVLSATLQAVIGIWEFWGGSGAAHLWILDYQYFRAFGTFGQPNPFGAFMAMILPIAAGISAGHLLEVVTKTYQNLSARREAILTGLFYGFCAVVILGGLLASWSRGAWLGFLGASVVMLWLLPRQQRVGTGIVLGGGLMVAMAGALGLLPQSVTGRLTGFGQDFVGFEDVRGVVITDENYAVVERLAHWQAAIGMAEDHPWVGVGFGNYEVAYPDYQLLNWEFALGHAHNYYLNLLAETGIIGTLSYIAMWLSIFLMTWRVIQKADSWRLRGLAVGLFGAWTHIAIHSLLDKLYVNNLFLHVGAMLGILAILRLQQRNIACDGDNAE